MKWRQVVIVALMLVLVFSLSGCSLLTQVVSQVASEATIVSGETQPTPTVQVGKGTAQPTTKATAKATAKPSDKATAVPTSESTEDAVDPSSLTALDKLDSYHMIQDGHFTTIMTDTTVSTSTIDIEIWENKDPLARRVIYTATQSESVASSLEFINIGSDSYMKSSDSADWLAMSTSTTETTSFGAFSWFTDPASAMQGESKLIGTETINGMAAKHYRYSGVGMFGLAIGTAGTVDISQADIWISNEFNLIIKYVSQFKGTDIDGVQSDYSFSMEVLEVNIPITIKAPEGVAKPGLPDDVPMMDGATDVNAFAGIVSFKIDATIDEVTAFYSTALVENGWTPGEDQGVPGIASYTKDTRTLTLMPSDDNGSTSVTIMIQELS